MKIIVDCQGGDFCPREAVVGALVALDSSKSLSVILAGRKDEIEAVLAECKYDLSRVEILDASEIITNDDSPSLAIRRKKDSSTVKGLRLLKDGGADGMVSSANTGALLIGGTLILGLGAELRERRCVLSCLR